MKQILISTFLFLCISVFGQSAKKYDFIILISSVINQEGRTCKYFTDHLDIYKSKPNKGISYEVKNVIQHYDSNLKGKQQKKLALCVILIDNDQKKKY